MLPRISAKFETTLSLKVNIGDETGTLTSVTDADGSALPNGTYGFTIDEGNSDFEYIEATITGTALSSVKSFSATALTETTGFSKNHRAGAEVKITDFTILGRLSRIFRGEEDLDSSAPLAYDSAPTLSDTNALATVQYVLDNVTGGSVTFDSNVVAGVAGEAISSGDWMYFDESDGRWYQTDANDKAKSVSVKIGKARGAGTTGNAISGGVFVGGIEKVGTYVAGTKYYLSNTAGELSTSAGEEEVLVGIGDANTDLIFVNLYDPESVTQDQKDALAGTLGDPTSDNKYVTDNNTTSLAIDQSQTTQNTSIPFGEADATGRNNEIVQSFIPLKNKERSVIVYKKADTGTFTGTVELAIQADSSGEPSGVDLATKTLSNSAWTGLAEGEVEFIFDTELTGITAGNTYWIRMTSSTADNSNHPNLGYNNAGGYANGALYTHNSTDGFVVVSSSDLYFKVNEGVTSQITKTDSSGLLDKRLVPELDYVGIGGTSRKVFTNFQIPFMQWDDGTPTDLQHNIWTISGSGGEYFYSHARPPGDLDNASIRTQEPLMALSWSGGTPTYTQFDSNKRVIVELDIFVNTAAQSIFVGFMADSDFNTTAKYDTNTVRVGFTTDSSSNLYASAADGSDHSESDLGAIDLNSWTQLRIDYDPANSKVEYFVNGDSEAIISANLPTSSTNVIYFGACGANTSSRVSGITAPRFAVEI
jgi:hypothetical protein